MRSSKGAAFFVLAIVVVGATAYLLVPEVLGCRSTSCQTLGSGFPPVTGTSTSTSVVTTTQGAPAGTAYIDVWVNFTSGSPLHLSKQAPLSLAGSQITIGGKAVKAVTVQLKLSLQGVPSQMQYGGSVLVYTCGACGDQQVAIGNFQVGGPVSKRSFPVSSFPSLKATDNLTLLIWPADVAVSWAGNPGFVLAMSPVAVSDAKVASTTSAKSHAACPSSLPMYNYNLQQVGTATLVSYAKAVSVWGGTTDSDVGLLATYYLGSYTVDNVLVSNLGGPSGSHYGLYSGFHYNADGSCTS
jgi:hypothetical protein